MPSADANPVERSGACNALLVHGCSLCGKTTISMTTPQRWMSKCLSVRNPLTYYTKEKIRQKGFVTQNFGQLDWDRNALCKV